VYREILKPVLDVMGALLLLILVSPVFLFCCLVLFVANRGSVFFVQPRTGKNGRIFRVVKFRTMTDARDGNGELLPDHERLTAMGRFVRKTSLDELPQLLNVLSGNMSLVGPRPLLVQYLPLYNDQQRRRHEVRPGITGWAQVNGRNALSWPEKFNLDVWYVEHCSFRIDLKILFLTAMTVLKAKGISDGASETMRNFEGNQ